MLGDYSCIFQFFHELCELVGHGDGQGGDEDGVKKEREEAAARSEVGLDIVVDELLNDIVPRQSCHETKTTGG